MNDADADQDDDDDQDNGGDDQDDDDDRDNDDVDQVDDDNDDDYHLQTSKLFRSYMLWSNLVFLEVFLDLHPISHWRPLQYLSYPPAHKENLEDQLRHLKLCGA